MKNIRMPKINSIHFGGKWILCSILIGIVLPFIIYLLKGYFCWWLSLVGGIILMIFLAIFAIEMNQDYGKNRYYEQHLKEDIPFDTTTQYPIIKASICTGEQVAGFRSRVDNHFTEVMLINNDQDLEKFKKIYNLDEVKKEY